MYYTSGCVRLVSYDTTVAFRSAAGVWHIAEHAYRYSRSTTKHMGWFQKHYLANVQLSSIKLSLSDADFQKEAIMSGIHI